MRKPTRSKARPKGNARPARWWLPWALAAAEFLSLGGLLIFMLAKSWLRWSDPLIDFPKNLYLAWRISEGDRLYQTVTNWYGPLAHLVEAAAFRVFGVGIDTIVGMNIVLTIVVVLLLRAIFGALGNRLTGWLGAVVFIQVFAFGRYIETANFNFITPYASQATYSFLGLLLVLWGLLHHLKSERAGWLSVAGAGFGLAYLDKPEAILAGGAALGIYFALQAVRMARQPGPTGGRKVAGAWLAKGAGWLAGGFFLVWLPVFVFFLTEGGLAYAMRATNYAPLTLLNGSIRQAVENSPMMLGFFGFDHPWANFLRQTLAGGIMLAVCGVMIFSSWRATRARQYGGVWWAWVGLLLAAAIGGYGLAHDADDWLRIGRAIIFPVFLTTAGAAGWSVRVAWRGGTEFKRALGLAVVGVAASLMLIRMVLNANISHFGFFMMPLAALFWIQLVVGEAARPRPGSPRKNWLLPVAFSLLVLSGAIDLTRMEFVIYTESNMEVGSGRDRLYSLPLKYMPNGSILNAMIVAYQGALPSAKTVVAFPEGIAVNYHLRVPTTLTELEFHPTALGYVGPRQVLAELQAHPPAAIFVTFRNYDEFSDKFFGQSAASGSEIMQWVLQEYVLVAKAGRSRDTLTQDTMDLYAPKPLPAQNSPVATAPQPFAPR